MSWASFKTKLINKMQRGPNSIDEFADLLTNTYDTTIKTIGCGDVVSKNRLLTANKEGFRAYIFNILTAQSKSPLHLDTINLIAKGFPIYWTGATLSTEIIPAIPAPGSIFNISVVSNAVINPGIPVPILIPLGKSQTTEQWINNLIKAAKEHLKTISGTITTVSAYTPGPPPTGFVPAPGVILWTGFLVPEVTAQESEDSNDTRNENEKDDDTPDTEKKEFLKFIAQNGPIVSINKTIRRKDSEISTIEVNPNRTPPNVGKVRSEKSFPSNQLIINPNTLNKINELSPKVYSNIGAIAQPPPKGFQKYGNANIPLDKLVGVEKGSRDRYTYQGTGGWMLLHPEAASQYFKWKEEAIKEGIKWRVTSAYRDLAHQTELQGSKTLKAGTVAKAGTSPHGWAIALDFGDLYAVVGGSGDPTINSRGRESSALYRWMCNAGTKYGWFNPYRLCDGVSLDEMWHWEYHFGTATL